MMLAMVDDIRVVLIKLADRLHNMRTLQHLSPERQVKIAKETLEIYAPLAHRLGMGKVRGELEDLSFPYVDPVGYKHGLRAGGGAAQGRRARAGADGRDHPASSCAKPRSTWCASIRASSGCTPSTRRCIKQKITVDQMYDLLALRIITYSVNDCYAVLGIIHNAWRPVPGRIKDFIAMPRPNLYQSLHTTVIAEDGHPFEVQIRTEEMHKLAEEGIAAHWKYKDGPISARDEQRLAWLRQVVEWQREMADPERVPLHAEDRSLPRRGLHLHAQGQGRHPSARRHAHRLCLHRAHRGRTHLRGRQGERTHRSAALQAALGRHRRDHDPGRATSPAATGWAS